MKKKLLLLFIALLSIAKTTFSQEEKKQFIHKGLLRATATISPGIMLQENASTISIHGNLEYYVADNISLRGEGYYFLQAKFNNDLNPIHFNHSTLAGASYHFKTKNHFDPYLFFEPGLAYVQAITNPCPDGVICIAAPIYSEKTLNPLISSGIGFNYYFQNWFHVFGEGRYISGKYLSDAPKSISLDELRFSFGLGFNLSVFKPKGGS